jgi:hypothetical protein
MQTPAGSVWWAPNWPWLLPPTAELLLPQLNSISSLVLHIRKQSSAFTRPLCTDNEEAARNIDTEKKKKAKKEEEEE